MTLFMPTTRQTEVAQLLADGKTAKEAASILGIEHQTAKNLIRAMKQRMRTGNTLYTIATLLRNGVIE